MSLTDNIKTGEWTFTPDVSKAFDEHVTQSVPHYAEIQHMIAEISDWAAPNGSTIADLGASTGTTIKTIAERHPNRRYTAYLYDVEQHMLEEAKTKLDPVKKLRAYYRSDDIRQTMPHNNAALTIASLVLQFLPLQDRALALINGYRAAANGGTLIVVEKVRQDHPEWQEIALELTQERKYLAGLSDKEIRDKQASIRGVLNPVGINRLKTEITEAGWNNVEELFRWHCWVMIGAKKLTPPPNRTLPHTNGAIA